MSERGWNFKRLQQFKWTLFLVTQVPQLEYLSSARQWKEVVDKDISCKVQRLAAMWEAVEEWEIGTKCFNSTMMFKRNFHWMILLSKLVQCFVVYHPKWWGDIESCLAKCLLMVTNCLPFLPLKKKKRKYIC